MKKLRHSAQYPYLIFPSKNKAPVLPFALLKAETVPEKTIAPTSPEWMTSLFPVTDVIQK